MVRLDHLIKLFLDIIIIVVVVVWRFTDPVLRFSETESAQAVFQVVNIFLGCSHKELLDSILLLSWLILT